MTLFDPRDFDPDLREPNYCPKFATDGTRAADVGWACGLYVVRTGD